MRVLISYGAYLSAMRVFRSEVTVLGGVGWVVFTFGCCGLFGSERADFDVFQQDLLASAVVVAPGVDAVVVGGAVLLFGGDPPFLGGWGVAEIGLGFVVRVVFGRKVGVIGLVHLLVSLADA